MRNLILFSIAFAVVLTEADVDQLGFDVTESDFKNHFGIPEETTQEDGFVKNSNFDIADLSVYMTEEEKAVFSTQVEVESVATEPTEEAAPAVEPATEAPKQTAKEKADAKAAKAKEAAEAKAAAKATKDKEKVEAAAAKAAAAGEPKKPGVIASILEIIQTSAKPVSESEITDALHLRFPDKAKSSLGNTVKAQIGGKAQPLRMEQEKSVTFKLEEIVLEEGKKAVRHYSVVPNAAK